jgi:hypothetical protein
MSEMGKPPMPVVFTAGSGGAQRPAERLCFGETVFHRRPDALNPRLLTTSALGAGAMAAAIRTAVRRASHATPT